ncbi:cobalamin biosynthesis protein [Bacillus pseudomycoides]|uniref:Cobalamin biosynthesis protein n=1 Tax=Bacillus pseudomycoides TaxID=64104 RepID=A0AA91ZS18_9BACI|nr:MULTISPECIES: GTP-binding protein [Bacillus]PEB50571.1 cobalamin biosynthesis protein [Bacillus sp. AFS098217]PED81235.1 cobalamin biosynthesis protein [Bacillus pseudomycoides]PEU07057.1 cobalamin biosynthesis protein [Bacillus sp. AFS019443]PEU18367.1 cobalamin biosynthesis protein [Bacillus sp. AFS014408]PFW60536.1 cobalamin biosynthesis protein [Bacillus sp. AFS075034]
MSKVEIHILGGFLGSGKSTLLQNLLLAEKKKSRKVAVLMNEIGEYSVDTDIIGKENILRELLKGCICCTLKDELEIQLHSLYQQERPDVIYIETTGVAHPIEVLDACLSPILAPYIEVKSIIVVLDAMRWLNRDVLSKSIQQLLNEQIKYGSHILINKSDLLTAEEKKNILEEVAAINKQAKLYETQYCNISLEDIEEVKLEGKEEHETLHVKQHLHIQTMTYQFTKSIDQDQLYEWLSNLPQEIYRVKGFVKFNGDKYPHLLQYSFGVPILLEQDFGFPTNLVMIGEDLDKKKLKEGLEKLENSSV